MGSSIAMVAKWVVLQVKVFLQGNINYKLNEYSKFYFHRSGKSGASQYHIIIKSFLAELHERKEESDKLKERIDRLEVVRKAFWWIKCYNDFQTQQKEYHDLTVLLEGERYRSERLEEQINDLTELHQVSNDNQTIQKMLNVFNY